MSHGIDRRSMLKASAAIAGIVGLAGAASGAEPAAPPQAKRRPMKKAYFGLPKGDSLVDRMKILKQAGFDGLQLNLPDTKMPVDQLQAALKESGLEMEGVCDSKHWSLHLSDPSESIRKQGLEFLLESIRQCKALGGGAVLLVPGVVNEKVSYDDCYKRSQDEIRKAIPLASELGVKIAIENVWNNFALSPLEAARYVDEFESPAVGWYFDIGNVIHYGWPEQWIRILGKRIVRIHVKEFDRKKADSAGRYAGFGTDLLAGSNNWQAIMKALDDVGYAKEGAWATIEMGGGDLARMTALSQNLDKILAM